MRNLIDRKKLISYIMNHYYPKWNFHDLITIISEVPNYNKKDDWILISERHPNREEWLKHDCRVILTDGNSVYQGWYDYTDHYFIKEFNGIEPIKDKCAIAWMPLPERLTYSDIEQNAKKSNMWCITYTHQTEKKKYNIECYSYNTAMQYFKNYSSPLDTLLSIKDADGTEYYSVEEGE